jgi:hypothetical protein
MSSRKKVKEPALPFCSDNRRFVEKFPLSGGDGPAFVTMAIRARNL